MKRGISNGSSDPPGTGCVKALEMNPYLDDRNKPEPPIAPAFKKSRRVAIVASFLVSSEIPSHLVIDQAGSPEPIQLANGRRREDASPRGDYSRNFRSATENTMRSRASRDRFLCRVAPALQRSEDAGGSESKRFSSVVEREHFVHCDGRNGHTHHVVLERRRRTRTCREQRYG